MNNKVNLYITLNAYDDSIVRILTLVRILSSTDQLCLYSLIVVL